MRVKTKSGEKNKGLSKDSAEFIEKVRERFDQVIDETQVVDTVLHKSQLMRSDNALVKMEMSFMNEPQKTYNMLWRAAVLGGKKEFGKALLIYAATGLLTSLAASLMDAVRDDDEMKTFEEKYLKALTGIEDGDISTAEARDVIGSNLVDNLNMLGMMPYVKNIFSIISGFESERMDLAAMNDAIKTLQTLSKPLFGKENKKTVYGNAKMCARSLSRLTGIPAYNLMREAETLCETATNEKWQESE